MRSIRLPVSARALPAVLSFVLWLPGCSKATDVPTDSTATDSGTADSSSNETEITTDMPESAFTQLKDLFAGQVAGLEAQAQTLSSAAAQYSDAALKDQVAKANAKVADVRKQFDAMTYPGSIRAIQEDLPKMVGEAGEMISQALLKMQDVARAAGGSGGGDS